MRRIVVIRPGALGDTLLAFPALATLRQTWPTAQVTLIARADVLALALATDLATAVYPYDLPVWGQLFSESSPGRDPLLFDVLAGADAAVAWLSDPDGTVARNLASLGVARMLVVPGQPATALGEHAALYLLRTVGALGIHDAPASVASLGAITPRLVAPRAAAQAAAALWAQMDLHDERVVALHPGSGGAAKCWPVARFAALAQRLQAHGYVPLVLEGPADAQVAAALCSALHHAPSASRPGGRCPGSVAEPLRRICWERFRGIAPGGPGRLSYGRALRPNCSRRVGARWSHRLCAARAESGRGAAPHGRSGRGAGVGLPRRPARSLTRSRARTLAYGARVGVAANHLPATPCPYTSPAS